MKNVIYDINSNILDNFILKQYINRFFENRIRKNPNKIYFILLKLRSRDTKKYVTLHKGLIINNTSINEYINYINNQLSIKSNYYTETVMDQIIFEYFEVPNNKLNHFKNKLNNFIEKDKSNNSDIKFHNFSNSTINLKIPLNRNYEGWFKILSGQYFFKKKDNQTIFNYYLNGKLQLSFKDYNYNDNYFIREYNKKKYYIHKENQSIDLITKELETNFLENINKSINTKPKIITFEIETIYKDNNLILYLYSMYIGLFIVILNILIVDHIKNINILSYLTNFIKSSKFYTIIEFFFNRYITIWSKSKKPILIISLICIFINLFFIQLGLYIIIHHNPT